MTSMLKNSIFEISLDSLRALDPTHRFIVGANGQQTVDFSWS
jgi:hypothetical protein